MSEQLTGGEVHSMNGTRIARQQTPSIRLAKLWLTGLAATLLLGIDGAFAICPCGDGCCNSLFSEDSQSCEGTCLPPETPQTCTADCPGLGELTLRMTVVPFGDPGRFNLKIDGATVATNVGNGASIGPRTVVSGAHTVTETAGAGTDLADYRTTICGACAVGGTIQLPTGRTRSCSFTNLRPTAAGTISPARRLSIALYSRAGVPSASLTEADADRILAEMSDVLRAFDGSGDVACNVAYCRDLQIGVYAIGDGIIDTEDEEDDVFAVPQDVKVARAIDSCDGEFNTSILGCGHAGGSFIVERVFQPGIEGVIWAHEHGHVRGLEHRDPDDPQAVMNRSASVTLRKVNSQECAAYRAGAPLAAGAVAMAGPASAAAATDKTASLPDIRDFVRRLFIHGVPYEESIRYSPNVIPTLLEMLADPREERAWPNIVIVLGMLGDDRALTPLISFIEQNPGGRLDYNRYEAKKNAIFALGYLVNKSGNQQALAYLKAGLDPSVWAERGIAWTSPENETVAERNRELSRIAIIALGVSGDPSANEALRALLAPAPTATEREFREQMSGVISEALKANQKIAEDGLATYYRKPTP